MSDEALFKVELAVNSQTEKERENNAQRALLRLLTKVTGLRNIPRSEEVLVSLKEPGDSILVFPIKKMLRLKILRLLIILIRI